MCIYHVDIPSKAGQVVTDIAIQNPTTSEIKLPATSSVVMGVNEIAPLPSGSEGNMTMSNNDDYSRSFTESIKNDKRAGVIMLL